MLSLRMDLFRGSGCTPYGETLMPLSRSRLEQDLSRAAELLRGRQDSANVSDLLLALLFLKRCSDRFELRREEVIGLVRDTGRSQADAEASAENPRWYRNDVGIWLPPFSRFQSLLECSSGLAAALNRALAGVEVAGQSLQAVAAWIDFNRQLGRARLTDSRLGKTLQLFSQLSLANEHLAHPGVVSAAADSLFRDSDLPPALATLMVRLSGAGSAHSLVDPGCGVGGLLCAAADLALRPSGTALQLAAEEGDGNRWAVASLRLLLRGIRDARLDYLDGEVDHAGARDTPTAAAGQRHAAVVNQPRGTGVAELDGLRQLLARTDGGGRAVTLVSQDVLIGSGDAQDLRMALLDSDRVEAVIAGLPVRDARGAPACVLVLRQPLRPEAGAQAHSSRPAGRQGRVLLVDAGATATQGPALAQCCEAVMDSVEGMVVIPGFSTVVDLAALAANGYRIDIPAQLASASPSLPEDIKAHVHGGVPRAELQALQADLEAFGMAAADFFLDRDLERLDFRPEIRTREDIAGHFDALPGMQACRAAVQSAVAEGWQRQQALLVGRAGRLQPQADLATAQARCGALVAGLSEELVAALAPITALPTRDARALSAALASLWHEDLLTLLTHGYAGVALAWRDQILVAVESGAVLDHPLLQWHLQAETAAFNAVLCGCETAAEAADKARAAFSQRRFRARQRRLQEGVDALLPDPAPAAAQSLVLEQWQRQLHDRIDARLGERQRQLVERLQRCWDHYRYSLVELEARREVAIATLQATLRVAGHV